MTYKPPYGSFDIFFSGSKEARRKIGANQRYDRAYTSGRGFRDGRKSR